MRYLLPLLFLASPALAEMTLTLPDAPDGKMPAAQVLNGFGCTGGNLSPALHWTGAPEGTQSFVVLIHDIDAPTGSGFWHWAVFGLPGGTTDLAAGAALPAGAVAARNDFSHNQYDGACPPPGPAHRYVVTVFAMPQPSLPLDETASAAMVGFFANTGALDKASQTLTYGR